MPIRIPCPYFTDIAEIGDLYIRFIIVEGKYPVLFVAADGVGNLYLCVCCDIRYTQRWIIAPTDNCIIRHLLTNAITIRDAFIGFDIDKNRYLVEYSSRINDRKEKVDTLISRAVLVNEIPDEDLPISGETLEAEEGEFEDILSQL